MISWFNLFLTVCDSLREKSVHNVSQWKKERVRVVIYISQSLQITILNAAWYITHYSREQNKYIALKNHQNTISFGVIFILWHTKENIVFKKRLFSVVSRDCAYGSKGKSVLHLHWWKINIQFVCTPLKENSGCTSVKEKRFFDFLQ